MATLEEDIKTGSEWMIKAFESDGYKLDYSIDSLIEVDRFFQREILNGKPKRGGKLSKNLGRIIFSLSAYLAETIIKNVPNSKLITNDEDPNGEVNFTIEFSDNSICWPGQKIIKRVQNGLEDGIYPYAHSLTNQFTNEDFNQQFWEVANHYEPVTEKKSWWKIW